MRQKPRTRKSHGEKVVKDIRRATRKQYSAEEKIRIVLDGLKGEDSIAKTIQHEPDLLFSWVVLAGLPLDTSDQLVSGVL